MSVLQSFIMPQRGVSIMYWYHENSYRPLIVTISGMTLKRSKMYMRGHLQTHRYQNTLK